MALGLGRFSRLGNWSLDTRFKLGMGNLRRQVTISGSETINSTFVRPAGLLARATNSDIFIEDTFVVSPEFSIDLGYALTSNLDFSIGYNVLSIPKMAERVLRLISKPMEFQERMSAGRRRDRHSTCVRMTIPSRV